MWMVEESWRTTGRMVGMQAARIITFTSRLCGRMGGVSE